MTKSPATIADDSSIPAPNNQVAVKLHTWVDRTTNRIMVLQLIFLALPLTAFTALHESLSSLPPGWTEWPYYMPADAAVSLQIALSYQNIDALEGRLASVSEPNSATYGHYPSLEDLSATFGPGKQAANDVKSWLEESGVSGIECVGDCALIEFAIGVGLANKLLDADFRLYTDGSTVQLRTKAYSVPNRLGKVIDFVSPTTYFMKTANAARRTWKRNLELVKTNVSDLACKQMVAVKDKNGKIKHEAVLGPYCLRELYDVGDYKADPASGSTIGFSNFGRNTAKYSDLTEFQKVYGLPTQNFTATVINGAQDYQNRSAYHAEGNQDVQIIASLATGLPIQEYITAGTPLSIPDADFPRPPANEDYLAYLHYLLAQPDAELPYVISHSYADDEQTVPEKYARRVCNMIGLLGLRGRTMIFSSGDDGVGEICLNNENGKPAFVPNFPATCPYVTAVGGTHSFQPELGWLASSGGFSNYFPRPWYQESAVSTYLEEYIDPEAKAYYRSNEYANFSGRAFPDVAAHAALPDFAVIDHNRSASATGTSESAPIVAGVIALLNDARFRTGLPALGFANPWLYSISRGLNDVDAGDAFGCLTGTNLHNLTDRRPAYASWNATRGWDPVTGLGTPRFQAMRDVALNIMTG